jgi:hypothetical protein
VELTLSVGQPVMQTPALSICQNALPKVWGDTIFQTGTASGVYTFRRQTASGCDSIVNLTLTISETIEETVYDTVCQGEPYFFNGQHLTQSGIYTAVFSSSNGCDSTVILHLEVIDNVNVTFSVPQICADEETFTLILTQNSASTPPTNYEIIFAPQTPKEGFECFVNQYGIIDSNEIVVRIPAKIYPNHYSLQVILSDNVHNCPPKSFDIEFIVYYPDSIMEQKWDDVIALLNDRYNGGFKFTGYQWHHNDVPLLNENYSYIYLNDNALVVGDQYSVLLTREDGTQISTCPFFARVPRPEVSQYPTIVQANHAIGINIKSETAIVRIYSVTGILVAAECIQRGYGKTIVAPAQQGMYILEITYDDTSHEAAVIVVK